MMKNKVCRYCKGPLMKIDRYGEVLIGCLHCNRWGRPGDETLALKMMKDDLEALRAREQKKHPSH
jgi:hypothetical protein